MGLSKLIKSSMVCDCHSGRKFVKICKNAWKFGREGKKAGKKLCFVYI